MIWDVLQEVLRRFLYLLVACLCAAASRAFVGPDVSRSYCDALLLTVML